MTTTKPVATVYPITPQDQEAVDAMAVATAPIKGKITGPAGRLPFEQIMRHKPAAPNVTYEAATVGGIAGWWCRPAENRAPDSAVLFLHGGAYVLGSASTHLPLISQLVARTGVDFFAPDYRLAPEHPFPAAIDDALAAYHGLVALGKQRLALAGDSAGGGLALTTLARTTREAATVPSMLAPRAALVFSLWTDLALASPSMTTRAEADIMFTQHSLAAMAHHYLQGHTALDPQASPVYGDLAGLPPVQVHVGDPEVLLDDSVRYVTHAQAAGVAAELHLWEGMPHVFVSSADQLEAARQALNMGAAFLMSYLS